MKKLHLATDLSTIISNLIAQYDDPQHWQIDQNKFQSTDYDGMGWINIIHCDHRPQKHGWKIHLSAATIDLEPMLSQAIPVLIRQKAHFKLTNNKEFLHRLNSEATSLTQGGKFITIYPQHNQHAIDIATQLHQTTAHLRGPRIVGDLRFKAESNVYFRYGAFTPNLTQTLYGEVCDKIEQPDGSYFLDRRTTQYVEDPTNPNPFGIRHEQGKILKDRYFAAVMLSQGHRSEVYLGYDKDKQQRCVIKIAYKHMLMHDEHKDARRFLSNEIHVLRELQDSPYVPKLLDTFHDRNNNLVLVEEDISIKTVDDIIHTNVGQNRTPTAHEVIQFGLNLAKAINSLHQKNYIHNDIKCANIFYDEAKQQLKLIDFESCFDTNGPDRHMFYGSAGFSNKQHRGKRPTARNDLFSYGAVLLYYATSMKMPIAADINPLQLKELINLLNPTLPNEISRLILSCLEAPNSDVIINFDTVIHKLKQLHAKPSHQLNSQNHSQPSIKKFKLITDAKHIVEKLSHIVHAEDYLNRITDGVTQHDLRGTAGILLALCEYASVITDTKTMQLISELSQLLINNITLTHHLMIPGLYCGHSGLCLALLKAGIVLSDHNIVNTARTEFQLLRDFPHESVELYTGSAGRLKVAIAFHQHFNDIESGQTLQEITDAIVSQAHYDHTQQTYAWVLPDHDSTPNHATYQDRISYLGYAHGMAGILDALVDAMPYIDNQTTVSHIVHKATSWLLKQVHHKEGVSAWPRTTIDSPTLPFWCHGAAGIAKYLLNYARHFNDTETMAVTEQVGDMLCQFGNGTSPVYCHGIAGNLDILIDINQQSEQPHYSKAIATKLNLLSFWVNEAPEDLYRTVGITPHCLMNGLPGILLTYAKLLYVNANALSQVTNETTLGC